MFINIYIQYISKFIYIHVLVTLLYTALCDPMDCNLPGSSVPGILQANVLELAAIPFSREFSQTRDRTRSPVLQADSLLSEPPGKPKVTSTYNYVYNNKYLLINTL